MRQQDEKPSGEASTAFAAFKAVIPYVVSGIIGASGAFLATFRTMELRIADHERIIEGMRADVADLESWQKNHSESSEMERVDFKTQIAGNAFRIEELERDLDRHLRYPAEFQPGR